MTRIVTGSSAPIQGWIAYQYGRRVAAPVVEAMQTGRRVRYLTLLLPAAGQPSARVSGLRLTPTGYTVVISIGAHAERVTIGGTGASITTIR
jgi:hypothetical protein